MDLCVADLRLDLSQDAQGAQRRCQLPGCASRRRGAAVIRQGQHCPDMGLDNGVRNFDRFFECTGDLTFSSQGRCVFTQTFPSGAFCLKIMLIMMAVVVVPVVVMVMMIMMTD